MRERAIRLLLEKDHTRDASDVYGWDGEPMKSAATSTEELERAVRGLIESGLQKCRI